MKFLKNSLEDCSGYGLEEEKRRSARGENIILFAFIFFVFISACNSGKKENGNTASASALTTNAEKGYKLVEAFPALKFNAPVELTSPDDGSNRIFVLEQKGIIQVISNTANVKQSAEFLNIKNLVESGGEKGLLGLAFHPDFKNNGFFYVNYTSAQPLHSVIARFKVNPADNNRSDAGSEEILLTYNQPYGNHNGGKLAFGNDGFLYIAVGDGGSGGDPQNRAQNKKELFGKILRIDVEHPSANMNYGIPTDNPFYNNQQGYRPEIYSFGMRNPWRFSFDKKTGWLWAGDVGQNKIEEVDIIEKGGNYGWNIMEANECFKNNDCNKSGLVKPVWSYEHGSETGLSVTGGYVCRDKNLLALNGKYIYGDYVTGNIWALTCSGKKAVSNTLIAHLNEGLSSFGEDSKSNLYVLGYSTGKVFRLIAE